MDTVTISIERFKELEAFEKAYKESSNMYYGGWGSTWAIKSNEDTVKDLKNHYSI
jgi:hypothetical protein